MLQIKANITSYLSFTVRHSLRLVLPFKFNFFLNYCSLVIIFALSKDLSCFDSLMNTVVNACLYFATTCYNQSLICSLK